MFASFLFAASSPIEGVLWMVVGAAFWATVIYLLVKRSQQKADAKASAFQQFRKDATPEEWSRYLEEKERAEEREKQKRRDNLATGASIIMGALKKR